MFIPKPDVTNSASIWKETFIFARSLWKQTMIVCLVGMMLPLTLFYTFGWIEAARSVAQMTQVMALPATIGFEKTLEYLVTYIGKWSFWGIIAFIWIEIGFLWLITTTHSSCRSHPPASYGTSLLQAVRVSPKFFITLIFIGLILLLSQTFSLLFLVLSTLLFMVPITMIHEKCGIFRAISNSLTLAYAGPIRRVRFYVFFQLISAGMIFLLYPILIIQAKELLTHFDDVLQIPRELWIRNIPSIQISLLLFTIDILFTLLLWVGISVFAMFMTVFYCLIQARNEQQFDK